MHARKRRSGSMALLPWPIIYCADRPRRQQSLLMQARNSHVEKGLQKAYASKVPGGNLDVFCVSNTLYEKYAEKGNGELVRASCIPELRQFCYSITAEAHFQEALHFLRSELLNLLTSLQMWTGAGGINQLKPQIDGLNDSMYHILYDVGVEVRCPSVARSIT